MELGALVCIPGTPHCGECPLADLCRGYAAGRANQLPVKPAPKAKGKVPVTVALIEVSRDCFCSAAPHGDCWPDCGSPQRGKKR